MGGLPLLLLLLLLLWCQGWWLKGVLEPPLRFVL
jgi:hypothetical protein